MAEGETLSRKYSGLFRVRETCVGGAVALETKQDVCRGARGGPKCPVPDSVGLTELAHAHATGHCQEYQHGYAFLVKTQNTAKCQEATPFCACCAHGSATSRQCTTLQQRVLHICRKQVQGPNLHSTYELNRYQSPRHLLVCSGVCSLRPFSVFTSTSEGTACVAQYRGGEP